MNWIDEQLSIDDEYLSWEKYWCVFSSMLISNDRICCGHAYSCRDVLSTDCISTIVFAFMFTTDINYDECIEW
jgi:hypothetical protein